MYVCVFRTILRLNIFYVPEQYQLAIISLTFKDRASYI